MKFVVFLFLLVSIFIPRLSRADIYYSTNEVPVEKECIVTFRRPSDYYFFVQDDQGIAWRVNPLDRRSHPRVCDRIRVTGKFPKRNARNNIEFATFQKIGTGDPPTVREMSVEEMYELGPEGEIGKRDWYGQVVAVNGLVLDINRRETFTQILIGRKKKSIQIVLPIKWEKELPQGLTIGALVRAKGAGVYSTLPDNHVGKVTGVTSFSILLAQYDDFQIIEPPPFWTIGKVLILSGIGAALFLFVILLLQRKRRLEKIAADAVRRERLRLTSELHDNIQQLLAGCMFLLGSAQGKVEKGQTEAVKSALARLRDSLNHAQSELRATLWGLTEEAEGPRALTDLFRYAAGRMPQWEGKVHFTVQGKERKVARRCSGALLLILLEAVGNSIKHGRATKIDVTVDFTETALLFAITDNGCGFDPEKQSTISGHLGIENMRRHAEGVHGTMAIASSPGKGTTITVRIPL